MPLPAPVLDDRSYQQLRDELVRRIPVYTPEWTDHNPSDPGITFLELFAFLGENLLFKYNQIPESTRLAFLNLLQIPLRPANPARALLVAARTDLGAQSIVVEAGSEAKAGALSFETRVELRVLPLEGIGYGRILVPTPPTTEEALEHLRSAIAAVRLEPDEHAELYDAVQIPRDPAAPEALPVDLGRTVDNALWIAVLASDPPGAEPLENAVLNIGFVPEESPPTIGQIDPCPGPGASVVVDDVVWEASTGELDANDQPIYTKLDVVHDGTRALSCAGIVRVQLPSERPRSFALPDPYLAGTGDFPPDVREAPVVQRLEFWLRATRRGNRVRRLGPVLWVGLNATDVEQVQTAGVELLGTGNGDAHQTYALVHGSVLEGSIAMEVEEAGRWTAWSEIQSFDASGPDRHFTVDHEAGTVRFGDGVRGRVPQIGERIRVRTYRHGGGLPGNVPAKAIARLTRFPGLKIANPLPARGGANAESIEAALERVPGELRRRDRAVTADDFRELALQTPGADLGRADTIARFHPSTQDLDRPGVVTVVVWPREDRRHPNAPVPDRSTLRQVCQWLDARRLVTTELYVVPPTYREIAVAVGLQPKPGYGIEALRRWVELVLRQYLAPLPPYGPEGAGWPLGRHVFGPELEAVALQVEGIEFLKGLSLAWRNPVTNAWIQVPRGGDVQLRRWEVPELGAITVVQGDPLVPGQSLGPPPTLTRAVPVPIFEEEC